MRGVVSRGCIWVISGISQQISFPHNNKFRPFIARKYNTCNCIQSTKHSAQSAVLQLPDILSNQLNTSSVHCHFSL